MRVAHPHSHACICRRLRHRNSDCKKFPIFIGLITSKNSRGNQSWVSRDLGKILSRKFCRGKISLFSRNKSYKMGWGKVFPPGAIVGSQVDHRKILPKPSVERAGGKWNSHVCFPFCVKGGTCLIAMVRAPISCVHPSYGGDEFCFSWRMEMSFTSLWLVLVLLYAYKYTAWNLFCGKLSERMVLFVRWATHMCGHCSGVLYIIVYPGCVSWGGQTLWSTLGWLLYVCPTVCLQFPCVAKPYKLQPFAVRGDQCAFSGRHIICCKRLWFTARLFVTLVDVSLSQEKKRWSCALSFIWASVIISTFFEGKERKGFGTRRSIVSSTTANVFVGYFVFV